MTPLTLTSARRGAPRRWGAALAAAALLTPLTACSSDGSAAGSASSTSSSVPVVASFYPVQWLAESIGGDAVTVTSLTPPGTEPHDLSVDAAGLRALNDAAAVLYLGADFQPDVERAVGNLPESAAAVDLLQADGVRLITAGDIGKETLSGGKDPHVWLDPLLMAAMATEVERTLSAANPAAAEAISARADQVRSDLESLNGRYVESLKPCAGDTLVTSHMAFGYLADRYDLRQVAIAGVSPEDEPDAKTLAGIARTASDAGVRTVFFEDSLPDDLARTVADQIDARIDLLSALEFDPRTAEDRNATYVSVMDRNRESLTEGLVCGR